MDEDLFRGVDNVIAHIADRVKRRAGGELHVELVFSGQGEKQHGKRVDAQVIDQLAVEADRALVELGLDAGKDFLESLEYRFFGHGFMDFSSIQTFKFSLFLLHLQN